MRKRPEAILGNWEYKEILRLRLPTLVRSSGVDALKLICDLLDQALGIDNGPSAEGEDISLIREDYSTIWRANLSVSNLPGNEDVQDSLVSAVRDAALQIVGDHPDLIDDVVAELQDRRWTVFWRISLDLLREAEANGFPLACTHLTNPVLANEQSVESEYLELLRTAFGAMTSDCQNKVLQLIDGGPETSDLRDDLDKDWYIRRWRWRMLAAIKNELSADRQNEWRQLSAEFGTDLELRREGVVTWMRSPEAVGVERLSEMPLPEIVELLGGFEPGDGFGRPTADDLARELTQAVAADPNRFAADASGFDDVSLVYQASLIGGFKNSAEGGREFDWIPVLALCKKSLSKAGALSDRESHSARREAVGLLQSGLAPKGIEIPFEFRPQVWEIIAVLIEDPDPSPETEADRPMGGYGLAINTIRGRAVEAAIYYGIWVYRHTKPGGTDEYTFNLGEAPELREALERHCDVSVDSSPVVRSVYGAFLPTLHGLDKDWVTDNLGKLFPTDAAMVGLRQAVWEAYVLYARLDLSMLVLLRDEYARSIELVGSSALEEYGKPDERIGMHLVIFYWHGRLALNDSMLVRFFEVASDEVRDQVLANMGQDLRKDHEPLPADVTARLKALWEWRIEEARMGTGGDYKAEMAAFGWTFASGELGDSWALRQLEATLRITGRTAIDHQVVERLASLAGEYPADTLRCLEMMVDGAEEEWQIHHWAPNMESVLTAVMRSGDDEATQAARALMHRLGARGFLQFASLLEES